MDKKARYIEHMREQYGEDIQFVHTDKLDKSAKIKADPENTTDKRSVIEMYRAGDITGPEMKRILNVMEINGLDKSQLHDVPYATLKKITG